jgi:hypothetical protein
VARAGAALARPDVARLVLRFRASAKAQSKRTRDGSVGRDTFNLVEALVKEGKTKTEAFEQITRTNGKNSVTVAANYYRIARVR